MSKDTITHEVKLQPAVIVILGIMAVGILANAFPKASPIQDAMAESLGGSLRLKHSGMIECFGCN